jgi:uncharacterized protein involved in exopolysaccharide biosynthesis
MDPLQVENSYDYRNRVRRFLQDQKETILSNRVLLKVVQELFPNSYETESTRLMDEIRKHLDVTPPGGETFEGSNVFIIEFTDSNPSKAARIATLITNGYLEAYSEMSRSKTDYSHRFFLEETRKLNDEMIDKQNKLRKFETREAVALIDILNMETGRGSNQEVGPTALLSQSIRNYHELQTELAGLNVFIDTMEREINKKGIPVVLPEMEVYGRTIAVFKTKVAQLQIQINEMKTQFKGDFEPLKQVEQELDFSVDSLKKELERTVTAQKISARSIDARIRQLEKTISELKERIQLIAKEKATYETLKQDYHIAKDAYTRAMAQLEQSRMASSLNQEKQFLTLIDIPVVPLKPYKPNRILLFFGGLISGFFLGVAVALTVDHFDHRIKTVYDIKTYLNVPFLGSVSNI